MQLMIMLMRRDSISTSYSLDGRFIKPVILFTHILQKFHDKIHKHIVFTEDIYKSVVNAQEIIQEFLVQYEVTTTNLDQFIFLAADT